MWSTPQKSKNAFSTFRPYNIEHNERRQCAATSERRSRQYQPDLLPGTYKPNLPGTTRNVLENHDGSHLGLPQRRYAAERGGQVRVIRA